MLESSTQEALNFIHPDSTIWWLRRDLRLQDNAALYYALKENQKVIPLFIFDTEILGALDDTHDKRVEFIHHLITSLKDELALLGSSLLILHGNPIELFKHLNPASVYTARDYEPYAIARDRAIATDLNKRGIVLKSFKDQVIFEEREVVKSNGDPYTIFTPYSRKWKEKLNAFYIKSYPTERYFKNLQKCKPFAVPSLSQLGFHSTGSSFPPRVIKLAIIRKYHQQRNFPAVQGTSRLKRSHSVWHYKHS